MNSGSSIKKMSWEMTWEQRSEKEKSKEICGQKIIDGHLENKNHLIQDVNGSKFM